MDKGGKNRGRDAPAQRGAHTANISSTKSLSIITLHSTLQLLLLYCTAL